MSKLSFPDKVHQMMQLEKALALQEWQLPERERPCQFVTVRECASLLWVSERTIRRLIRSGEVPAYRLHRLVRTRWSDIWSALDAPTMVRLPFR